MPLPLGRALSEIVRVTAAERPVVLTVDDAQWLDHETAGALATSPRPCGGTTLPGARAVATASAAGLGRCKEPHWPRLCGPDDSAATAHGRGASRARRAPVAWLRRGRARPCGASCEHRLRRPSSSRRRAVARRGLGVDLRGTTDAWPAPLKTLDDSLPGDLPDAVIAAIRIGFWRLSPDAQRARRPQVFGERVSASDLATALDLSLDRIHRGLDELEWYHWLVSEPRGYAFVARIVRQVVERDMLTPGQRRRLTTLRS